MDAVDVIAIAELFRHRDDQVSHLGVGGVEIIPVTALTDPLIIVFDPLADDEVFGKSFHLLRGHRAHRVDPGFHLDARSLCLSGKDCKGIVIYVRQHGGSRIDLRIIEGIGKRHRMEVEAVEPHVFHIRNCLIREGGKLLFIHPRAERSVLEVGKPDPVHGFTDRCVCRLFRGGGDRLRGGLCLTSGEEQYQCRQQNGYSLNPHG